MQFVSSPLTCSFTSPEAEAMQSVPETMMSSPLEPHHKLWKLNIMTKINVSTCACLQYLWTQWRQGNIFWSTSTNDVEWKTFNYGT